MNFKLTISNVVFGAIIFLLLVKYSFSYLAVDLDWWLRYLTPNHVKFNPLNLPRNLSEKVEYLLLPCIFLYFAMHFRKLGNLKLPLSLTIVLLLLNCMTAWINDIGIMGSIRFSLKISAPIYLFCVLIVHNKVAHVDYSKLLKWAIGYFLFLTMIGLLLFDESFNRGVKRLPVYFSGLHTHNYILTVTFIALSYFLRKHTYILLIYFFFTLAFLTFGYGVRTVIVFYLLYIAVVFYLKEDMFKKMYVKIIAYIPFLLLLFVPILRNFDFDRFSSGRLTMYKKKFDILKDYQPYEYLFGRGWGSDFVKTTKWWYAEKGSHNDYLTFAVENGFIYVLVFITLIGSLLILRRKNHLVYIVLIAGYMLTSLISNGFAVRAMGSYWLFTVLAFLFIKHKNNELSFG